MAELHSVGGTDNAGRSGDVVFVHGLDGDWRGTWDCGGADGFWLAWLAEDCPELGVWSVDYEAAASAWRGHAMPILDRATNLLDALLVEDLGTRPLCFVAHSMGGLLVKQMLRLAADRSHAAPRHSRFAHSVRGVVFLATPHTGADLATLAKYVRLALRLNEPIRDLETNASTLRDLNLWYRNVVAELGLKTKVYIEKQPMAGQILVDEASGDPGLPGVDVVPIDANHTAICKPSHPRSQVYRGIRQFLREALQPAVSGVSPAYIEVPNSQSDDAQASRAGRGPEANAQPAPSSNRDDRAVPGTAHPEGIVGSAKDFFVSYNGADRAWAEWIAWELESAGYTTIIQAWDFLPGSNFVLEMDQASREAARTIAVLSPDYVGALYTRPEWAAAFVQDPTGQRSQLLPVRVRELELRGLLRSVVYVDMIGLDEDTARARLLTQAEVAVTGRRAKPPTAPPFPGAKSGKPPPPFPGEVCSQGVRGSPAVRAPGFPPEGHDVVPDARTTPAAQLVEFSPANVESAPELMKSIEPQRIKPLYHRSRQGWMIHVGYVLDEEDRQSDER